MLGGAPDDFWNEEDVLFSCGALPGRGDKEPASQPQPGSLPRGRVGDSVPARPDLLVEGKKPPDRRERLVGTGPLLRVATLLSTGKKEHSRAS